MNKLAATIFILLFPIIAHADEYRGVRLGDSCKEAIEIEINHGSKPVFPVSEMLIDKPASFWTTVSGGKFYLTYHCENEYVYTIFLLGKNLPLSEAELLYQSFRKDLLEIYGKPCTDWRNLSFANWLKVWIVNSFSTDMFNAIDWKFENKASASLSIRESISESEKNNWIVTFRLAAPSEAVFVYPDGTEKSVVPDKYNCSL